MKKSRWSKRLFTLLALASFLAAYPASKSIAGESTLPSPPYTDDVSPDLASKYTYVEDGEFSKALKIPTYEWMPAGAPPKCIFLAIHGLTLHGRRYKMIGRSLAVSGAGVVAMDMRGFGRCKFDEKKQFSTADDDREKVDHEKSYNDIVQLAKLIQQKYPDLKIFAMGESLGCTFCVKLAAEHPELITAIVLSAPAVKVNKEMYAGRGQVVQGVKAVLSPHHELDLKGFFAELCSSREDVQKELLDDPLVLKKLTIGALLSTDLFVDKTAKLGKSTKPDLGVLILQGSTDGCVSPTHVTELMNNMPSDDQTLNWRGTYGHIQLETNYLRAQTVAAIADWLTVHNKEQRMKVASLEEQIKKLGGSVSK